MWQYIASGIVQTITGTTSMIEDCGVTGEIRISQHGNGVTESTGLIAGNAENIKGCYIVGNITYGLVSGPRSGTVGIIGGNAKNISDCYVEGEVQISGTSSDPVVYVGVIAGYAESINNCSINLTSLNLFGEGDTDSVCGIIAGFAKKVQNCCVWVDNLVEMVSRQGYGALLGGDLGQISNCILILNTIGTIDVNYAISNTSRGTTNTDTIAYNCVIIGYNGLSLLKAISATTDTTNGLYSVLADDSLKLKETYVRGTTTYQWNVAAPWSFDTIWVAADDYPILRLTYALYKIDIAINFSTNVDRSYLIYLLDESGKVAREFVVQGTGQRSVVGWAKNAKFTIFISHTLYMNCKIQNKDAQKMTFEAAENTTIEVSISAPTGVNNWVAI